MPDHPAPIDPANFDAELLPGEDFYRHVNDRWLEANPVPAEYPAWGAFVEVNARNEDLLHEILEHAASEAGPAGTTTQRVGDYYAAGMDETAITAAGTEPLQSYLASIDALTAYDALPDLVRDLQLINVSAFHGFGVLPDYEAPDRYLVNLGQGGLGLPEPGYYTRDDEPSAALRAAYLKHVTNQLANLGADRETAREQAERVIALETRLAASSLPPEKMRDFKLTINRFDATDLDELMPGFGMRAYVRSFGIDPAALNIDNPGFFRHLETIIGETPIETLRAYLLWHLVRVYASALPPSFEDEAFDFYSRTLGGQQEQQPRWKRILAHATGDIGEEVAQLYVREAFSEESKARSEQLVAGLVGAMRRSIEGLTWMTDDTRAAALEKLAAFRWKIGYPDTWRDYSSLEIDRTSFVGNRMRAAGFEAQRQLGRLDEPVDREEWAMPAHMVNAYYHPLLNEIVFPAGILQPPLFYADADDAVNFGGIGTVIGHEITHGFDDQGRQFDAGGTYRDWWTEADTAEFDRLKEQLVAQFDAYRILDDQPVNGRLTVGENIADLGGVAIALDALLEVLGDERPVIDGLTPAQRFFVAYATIWRINYTDAYLGMLSKVDVHAPGPFRVNGPLSNVPVFAEAFGVEPGSPMARTPEDRVKIW